jgi:hypothetical protein
VLTSSVLHTRDVAGSTGSPPSTNSPISVMNAVCPGRYTVLPNVKYRPELGGTVRKKGGVKNRNDLSNNGYRVTYESVMLGPPLYIKGTMHLILFLGLVLT